MPPPHRPRTVRPMSRTATAVVFEAVLPVLGVALMLGASILPALAIAVLAIVVIYAIAASRSAGPRAAG
jgi:hypothetical protein